MGWRKDLPSPAQLPTGLAGMVNHENRLLSEPTELFDAQGVVFDDLYVRKEPGTTAYDTTGLTVNPSFSGTLSAGAGSAWNAHLMAFQGTGTPSHVKTLTSGTADVVNPNTTGSVVLTVPAGGVPIGDLIVVSTAHNEDDSSASVPPITVTDTGGNTYTQQFYTNVSPSGMATFWTRATTALSAGNSITISYSGLTTTDQTVNLVAVADQFTGVTTGSPVAVSQQSNTGGSGATVTVSALPFLGGSPTLPIIVVATVMSTETSNTLTAASNFTKRTEAFNNGAALSVDDRGIRIASRIVTELPTIIGLWDWYSDAETTPAGTVSTISGSTTVTGAGTAFTNHAPGDRIVINNETRVISTITSNTVLDTTTEWVVVNTGVTYRIRVGNRIITAVTSGDLFKEKPLTLTTGNLDAVTLKSGLSQSARPGRFVVGGKEAFTDNRKLFYFNGVDPVQVLSGDGTSTTAITAPPSDWGAVADENTQPINGLIHENRLLAWGNLNDPHRIYVSLDTDHEDFTTTPFSLRFRSEIGDRIWCASTFQGVLFVWKYPRGVLYLDDTDLDITNWSVRVKSEAVGCAPSPFAALPIDDDVLFMAADGSFHLLSAVDALGGTRASDVTRRLGLSKWIRENLNLTRLNQVISCWYPQKKTAIFTVPSADSEVNDLTLKFDFNGVERGLPLKFSYSQRDIGDGLTIRREPAGGPETPILGQGGFVYLLDQEDRNANGVAYTGSYQTPHIDFSHIDESLRWRRKQFEKLELLMEPVSAGELTVEVYVDGSLKQTLTFDATLRRQDKKLECGDGFTLSLKVTNSTLDEDFKVLSHLVYFKVGNEDKNRGG